jgi:glycosyltransferase involved in cell wall biosynthesis
MQVSITVPGRWHAFTLAQQLFKRGSLKQLITSYPKFAVSRWGIPQEKVTTFVIKEALTRGFQALPAFLKNKYNPQYLILNSFDRFASSKISKTDILVAFSGSALSTLKAAKKLGAITVLERGSSHICFQSNILTQEYELFGFKYKATHPRIIEKELLEYSEANYISIPSSFVRKTFVTNKVDDNKLIQIPFGVDLGEFKKIPKVDNVFRVIYAGGLSLRKGVYYLLKAFSDLSLPKSELLLIGKLTDEIKPILRKFSGSFRSIGHIPQHELNRYYSQGSIFVLPSVEEGMALVQLQAMACGLPLISTTNTGAEDFIEDGKEGFIIPIRSVEAIKEKILFFYENPEKRELMSAAAQRKVECGFTNNDYGDRIFAAYKNILT